MSIVNLQQNLLNRQYPIYNYSMQNYDADAFADWLNEAYKNSEFKSFAAVADKANLSRSTVSSLAGAKKQALTDKPSQPKAATVIELAKVLNKDVDEALLIAGHAPIGSGLPEPLKVSDFEGFDKDDLADIQDYIRFKKAQKAAKNK